MDITFGLREPLAFNNVKVLTSGASYQMLAEGILEVNKSSGSATAVSLPKSPAHGQTAWVKDAKGDAGTNAITISDPNSKTIDGASSLVLNTNYASVILQYDGVSSTKEWKVFVLGSGGAGAVAGGSSTGTVAAAGSTQANAAALTYDQNIITGADGTKGVLLPTPSVVGRKVTVVNTNGSNALKVYPDSGGTGGTVNGGLANAAASLAANKGAIYLCTALSPTAWYSLSN